MNNKEVVKNTFSEGVVADLDPEKTGNNVMVYSLNGRVIYNRSGTLSWVNARGNELAISLPFDYAQKITKPYYIIGGYEIYNFLVLISTQNTINNVTTNEFYSEIGILMENQEGVYSYQTVFNDKYDLRGDLMHLNTRYQAKVQTIFENKDIIRGYWCDDFNEDRVINVVAAANQSTIAGINYFAVPYLPYTTQPTIGNNGVQQAVPNAKYPYWYSVHGLAELCDVQFGLIKYRKNIPGSKIAGQRQYFYRLKHASGYATPWSPGSGFILCTTPQVSGTDWTQYSMVNSGAATNKGHQIEIKYIDTRFSFIEVAWAYYETDTIAKNAGIFFQGVIQNLGAGNSMIINDISENVITIVEVSTLAQRYTDVIHSKTKLINENYQHKGNVALRGILEVDTSTITIEPFIRLMGSDNFPAFDNAPTPYTQGLNVTDDSVDVGIFDGFDETYMLGGSSPSESDYINYKGTQWDCLFKGEFRGQTVPFAIVLFSRKGQPFFAQHIGDFTMPEQFGTQWTNLTLNPDGTVNTQTGDTHNGLIGSVGDYTLTEWSPGNVRKITNVVDTSVFIEPVIKILGKWVSGIDLTDILYDQYGQLQISGFSIVRADRIPNLVAQGLIMNCSNPFEGNLPDTLGGPGNFITPLHSTGNNYTFASPATPYLSFVNTEKDHGGANTSKAIVGNYFTLELPDNLFNPAIISNAVTGQAAGKNSGFQIQLIGNVQANYVQDVTEVDCAGVTDPHLTSPPQVAYTSFYTKNYITLMGIFGDDSGGLNKSNQTGFGTLPVGLNPAVVGDFGYKTGIEKIWLPFGSKDTSATDIDNFKFMRIGFLSGFLNKFDITCDKIWHGLGTTTQVVVKVPNYANASLFANKIVLPTQNAPNHICYYLVNVLSGQPNVLNASVIQNRIYKNIGHFVPINAATIAAATDPITKKVVFNEVEVWGGDCYVDYFGYGRLIPLLDNTKKPSETPEYFDYGCGLIFPCETVYNHTMRIGNNFPSVSLRPGIDEDFANNPNPVFYSGLYFNNADDTDQRQEEFSINAVLQATDKIDTYSIRDIYFVDEPDQPLAEMVSNVKIPGETYDQFRLFLVNNQQLADSQYGFITDLQAIGHNIYVLQEKGFGRIRFNEYQQEVLPDGTNLTVGTGKGYQGHIYMGGADYGCQHEWSVVNNKSQFYWVNAYKGKHNRFGGNGLEALSDVHGQHQYFEDEAPKYWQIQDAPLQDANENIYDNPIDIGGIASIFDHKNQANVVTFTKQKIIQNLHIVETGTPSTMEFSDKKNAYQGNWSFFAGIYFSFKQDFFAYDKLHSEKFYVFNEGDRGKFFNVIYDSQISFIVHAERQFIFDNAEMDVGPEAFGVVKQVDLETVNSNQTVILNNPGVDNRPAYRNSAIVYPTMAIGQNERMRGSYMKMTYTIDNTTNTEVLFSEHREFIRKDFR